MSPTATVSLICLVLCVACVLSRRAGFVGTTLVAPYRWTLFAMLSLAVVELLVGTCNVRPTTTDALRYAAATSTFCPLIALLGAKRPQNHGWQFIVVTMWVVLILPVGETMLLWQGGVIDEGPARRWFLGILLFVGLTNHLLTRYWTSALLIVAGQSLLLLPHLPIRFTVVSWHTISGIGLITSGTLCAWVLSRSGHRSGWDGVWCDFRDAFGLVWSLRVMERMNTTAKLGGWTSSLTWYGFLPKISSSGEQCKVERAFRTLLRRFVDASWIEKRTRQSEGPPT